MLAGIKYYFFMSIITQEQLSKSLFQDFALANTRVREIAAQWNLFTAKKGLFVSVFGKLGFLNFLQYFTG
jgi:tRNA U34 2-thiouridine synthase MnmA/TrmU